MLLRVEKKSHYAKNKLNNKSLAPIVLFTYNRPDHLKKVLDSLMKNKESSISDLVVTPMDLKPLVMWLKLNK